MTCAGRTAGATTTSTSSRSPPRRATRSAGKGFGLYPGDPGVRPGGLPYPRSAAREGGPGNGVLTAIEDFVAEREGVRLVVVPAFFGFGVAWYTGRSWAPEVARILDPFDQHPVLERLEANRVRQLARWHAVRTELWRAQERLARQEAVLRRMLDSSAFTVAERLSRLRAGPAWRRASRSSPRRRSAGRWSDRPELSRLDRRCGARPPRGAGG